MTKRDILWLKQGAKDMDNRKFQHRSNGVFIVKVTDPEKKEASITRETLQKYREDVARFFGAEHTKIDQRYAKESQKFAEKALRGEDMTKEIFIEKSGG